MVITRSIKKTRSLIARARKKGRTIGFVPTMGALHAGHLSLVRASIRETDFVVVSIFINPKQFSAGEDLQRYPRTFKTDAALLRKSGTHVLFYPSPRLMYGRHFSTCVKETVLSPYLCGARRPGHFEGVCTVVAKLFNIVQPDVSFFGQKDYQQAQIIRRMVDDLNFPVSVRILPIMREPDGVAMSSRNAYLLPAERTQARALYAALSHARRLVREGERSASRIRSVMVGDIKKEAPAARIEYIRLVDCRTLKDIHRISKKALIALAVRIGKARLIDNIIVRCRQ